MSVTPGKARTGTPMPMSQAVSALCPPCGLCCDGTLFADVHVPAGESVQRLSDLGLGPIKEGRRWRLPQPCPAHQGRLCGVYADRPPRCREFECAILRSVQQGARTPEEALEIIASIRREASALQALLRRLGDSAAQRPLASRCAAALARPIDLASDDADRRGELLLAHARFQERIVRAFLDPGEGAGSPPARGGGRGTSRPRGTRARHTAS